MTRTVLVVIGTRPEAIKLAPVVHALRQRPHEIRTVVCLTGQHRELVHDVLGELELAADHDLAVMTPLQTINDVAARVLTAFPTVLQVEKPDLVLVQGDTVSATSAGLAAFYAGVEVGHVEAGLRTGMLTEPFPEEGNRRLLSAISSLHLAPTATAAQNLLRENVDELDVVVTGNTGIDAFRAMAARGLPRPPDELASVALAEARGRRLVLVTVHRRENQTSELPALCEAVARVADLEAAHVVFPMHPNPVIRSQVRRRLHDHPSVSLTEPLGYGAMVWLLARSRVVLTDSGGLQEEAVAAGRPVLVLRTTTDRPEGVASGGAELVGSDVRLIVSRVRELLSADSLGSGTPARTDVYGDGQAAARVVEAIRGRWAATTPAAAVRP